MMRILVMALIMTASITGFSQTEPVCPRGEGWAFDPEFSGEFNSCDNDYYTQALYIMFDCEIMQGWVGLPDPTDLPATFEIDYLRVWRQKDLPYPMVKCL